MSTSKILLANGEYDLSEVKTLEDLREEISFLRASVRKHEQELEDRLLKLPHEALKATADAVLPSFLNRMIANGSWKILASGVGMLANPFSKKYSFGKTVLTTARRLGLMALLKGAYNFWKSKKAGNIKTSAPVKQAAPTAKKN